MGASKLADETGVTIKEAEEIIRLFFRGLPKLKAFLDLCHTYVQKFFCIRTARPIRTRRLCKYIPGDNQSLAEAKREAGNTFVQGTSAQLTKIALQYCHTAIKENNYPVKLIGVIHDAILAECKEEFAEEWRNIQDTLMEKAGEVFYTNVKFLTDSKISKQWEI